MSKGFVRDFSFVGLLCPTCKIGIIKKDLCYAFVDNCKYLKIIVKNLKKTNRLIIKVKVIFKKKLNMDLK